MLTQLLVESTYWTIRQKKTTASLVSSKIKIDNCYLGPILDIMFRKWFPLSKVPSPRTITPKQPTSLTNQER
jgi:hypothetical protein